MRKKMWLASMLAAFLLTAGTVQAQSVSDKISALEQELQQLKEQQIELKKEATAAAAAMPSFSYRPGNGVEIEAADKAWGLRFTNETHFRYNFEEGRDQTGEEADQALLFLLLSKGTVLPRVAKCFQVSGRDVFKMLQ